MKICSSRGALILFLCLSLFAAANIAFAQTTSSPTPAGCTPTTQPVVAPGDIITLKGPDVAADQAALGITWDYQWTVKENDANGAVVKQSTGQSFSFTVPATGYKDNYYIDLMVTAHQAQLCINEACMKFPIVAPGPCTIASKPEADKICVSDTSSYTYSTAATPSQVNQRWWIFPLASLPTTVGYNDQANNRVGDGNSITINWNKQSGGVSGTYVVYTAYYAKKSPYAFQGTCQYRVAIVAVPSSTISITSGDTPS